MIRTTDVNLAGDWYVRPGMKRIPPVRIGEPGLVVFDIAACDEETALAAAAEVGRLWASNTPSKPWRVPGENGVRVRTYADTRSSPDADEELETIPSSPEDTNPDTATQTPIDQDPDAAIKAMVDTWPPLTPNQRQRLSLLLRPERSQ